VKAQSAVKFKDAKLEAEIKQQLGIRNKPLTLNVLQGIKDLYITNAEITSLEGIQALRNLTTFNAFANKISDVKPLAGLTKLTTLELGSNHCSQVKKKILLSRQ
jgi:internalin A